jgi:Cd2+/Zn2+-exporting ATPase
MSMGASASIFSAKGELRAAVFAGALLGLGVLLGRTTELAWSSWLVWTSFAIGFVYGGRAAWDALRQKKVDIDVLMIVGAGLAAVMGAPAEGALLLFLFVLAGALEELAAARTRREVEALHALMPAQAEVWHDVAWVEVEPMTLKAGDQIRIKPGQRVPADARVERGETEMDQSAMTGESVTRHVTPGDEIFSGTINVDDPIEAVVLRPAAQSSLQKVLNLVMSAREQREPVQRAIDRLSEPYAKTILGLSLAVLLVWRYGFDFAWNDAAYVAITFLIIGSPCALIIATPTATLAGIARAAKFGVLFKGGQSAERLAAVAAVCFDKTGTLTVGRPRVEALTPVGGGDESALLALAAALEGASTHPIASAVNDEASARGVAVADLRHISHTTGRGMSGITQDGTEVRLGSLKHVEAILSPVCRESVAASLASIQSRGKIVVVVARAASTHDAGDAMVMTLADAVRPGAAALVNDLHAIEVAPVRMLTGDNAATAKAVAEQLGIDRVDAELLPADKLRIVGEMKQEVRLRATGRTPFASVPAVAVIGDGVNDAPALAAADVAIAIGSIGSDAALESADIVLLSDDLSAVPWAVRLARRMRSTIRTNLIFALSVILLGGIVVLVGSVASFRVPMAVGVLLHEGGTLLVVGNSLRLLLVPGPVRIERPHRTR